jgi:ATP-dependent protease HslVU (ClpYQ) peptidase subunit
MTAIVGLVHDGRVYIGGDSAGVSGLDITLRRDPKVFVNGPLVIGYTSSFRMGQLLRYQVEVPQRHGDVDVFQWMVTGVVEAMRSAFKNGGYARKENEQEQGGFFLVGYQGRLFEVGSDYQVGEPRDGYEAIGCGEDYAKGSLHSTQTSGLPPKDRLLMALRAAEHHSAGVVGPFVVEEAP